MNDQEKPFQDRLLNRLGSRHDMRVWRQNVGQIAQRDLSGKIERWFHAGPPNGAADISGIYTGGIRLEIECKASTGKLRAAQKAFGQTMQRFGGVYVCVYGPNVDEAERLVLDAIGARLSKRACAELPAAKGVAASQVYHDVIGERDNK
jgi:hypothetical protein